MPGEHCEITQVLREAITEDDDDDASDSQQCSINFSEYRKSALDKNIEAKDILEMAGKPQLS